MVIKKVFFVLFAVVLLFSFTSSVFASDTTNNEEKSEMATDTKSEVLPDINIDKKDDMVIVKKVNINKATANELSSGLRRVGPKNAQAILQYREDNGEFKEPEDIKKVKGIGDKIFELNKSIIVVKD